MKRPSYQPDERINPGTKRPAWAETGRGCAPPPAARPARRPVAPGWPCGSGSPTPLLLWAPRAPRTHVWPQTCHTCPPHLHPCAQAVALLPCSVTSLWASRAPLWAYPRELPFVRSPPSACRAGAFPGLLHGDVLDETLRSPADCLPCQHTGLKGPAHHQSAGWCLGDGWAR